eukprot:7377298-Prymnesium_polylepis.1
MLNIRPARRNTSRTIDKTVAASRPRTSREPARDDERGRDYEREGAARNGFDVTYAQYSARRSIYRRSEHRTTPPVVCDA